MSSSKKRQAESPASASSPASSDYETSHSHRSSRRRSSSRKGPWTPEEDDILRELVEKNGAKNWSVLAKQIPGGRMGKQCRERYYNHLAPDVKKDPWSDEEDRLIIKAHADLGNRWTDIARLLGNGRPANDIKNRWNSALKKRSGADATTGAVTPAPATALPAKRKASGRCSKQEDAEDDDDADEDGYDEEEEEEEEEEFEDEDVAEEEQPEPAAKRRKVLLKVKVDPQNVIVKSLEEMNAAEHETISDLLDSPKEGLMESPRYATLKSSYEHPAGAFVASVVARAITPPIVPSITATPTAISSLGFQSQFFPSFQASADEGESSDSMSAPEFASFVSPFSFEDPFTASDEANPAFSMEYSDEWGLPSFLQTRKIAEHSFCGL